MRDNIKPIEAGFFKYCMRNLNHKAYYSDNVVLREDSNMYSLMGQYSKKI